MYLLKKYDVNYDYSKIKNNKNGEKEGTWNIMLRFFFFVCVVLEMVPGAAV
jgi:hypothetical protein